MKKLALTAALTSIAAPALAHTGHAEVSGLAQGLMHPLTGTDHLLAMLAVGLWSGFVLPHRPWAGALAFLSAMLAGAGLGFAGGALPLVEPAITASVLLFGAMVVIARRGQSLALTGAGLGAIALFGGFHGFAHASEATGSTGGYIAGFLVASAGLHLAGIVLARLLGDRRLARLVTGAGVVAGGVLLIAG